MNLPYSRKNRKLYFLFIFLIIAFVFVEWIIPQILLKTSTVSTKAESVSLNKDSSFFVNNYDSSRKRFLSYPDTLKKYWSDVTVTSLPINKEEGLYIDVIQANANVSKDNLMVLSSGTHGIEGYVGSAMMDVYINDHVSSLDPDNTGLILIHAINPYGMKNYRRYNENNVDLNRNFIYDWKQFDLNTNKDYQDLSGFLQKENSLGNITLHEIEFHASLIYNQLIYGSDKIENALLAGQYMYPKGVYYGGQSNEASTIYVKKIFHDILDSDYNNIVHVDLHSGYGPKYQMSIFSSIQETMTEEEAKKAYNYPLVLTPSSDEFYITSGDITEYFYKLKTANYPDKNLYTTTFEFGTLGDDLIASIKSLKNTVDENRLFWYESTNKTTTRIINNRYLQMFYPSEEKWRKKAVEDFNQAINGILKYKKMIH